ncbi:hypothetical protein KGF56_003498 [Candida oxycetoniae]|uniref:Enoyl reductase (ER) domain-containing protein n=1 Tax=Candida oxycetoniae TaxID=497107 RepID=A0AAI9SVW6_9ASCO|nr:uncharacterized protein KGF56_003498 [Candida oxycetoniae]KAI3403680.2 hypothetical protein KGF56_003498 [Candida oxycetoniae]
MPTQVGYGYDAQFKTIQKFANLPIPEPGPDQLVLKVEAAGLCLSDPHTLQGGPIESMPPTRQLSKFVMGHEIAGSVYSVGEQLKQNPTYCQGARFALQINHACGVCDNCRRGLDGSCSNSSQAYGLNEDGGFQQFLLIKNLRTLLPIPDNVSFEAAAVATDSVLTPFHAIQKVKHKIQPTSKVLVQGCGGLGLNAIQILKNYNCTIIATDVKEDIKKTAIEYGASEFYSDMKNCLHPAKSFDVIFDFVGIQPTVDNTDKFIKQKGTVVMVGIGRYKLKMPNFTFLYREVQVIYNFGGNSSELGECLNWISKGLIKPNYKVVDFNKLPQMLKDLEDNKVRGRIVFRPNKL